MNATELLAKIRVDRKEMVREFLTLLKARLQVPNSFFGFRGYTPSFNDGDACLHTWAYYGFGPGWIDAGYLYEDHSFEWDPPEIERPSEVTVPEEDWALAELFTVLWEDLVEEINERKGINVLTSEYIGYTDGEGSFYVVNDVLTVKYSWYSAD
jgi:hypothetical protein